MLAREGRALSDGLTRDARRGPSAAQALALARVCVCVPVARTLGDGLSRAYGEVRQRPGRRRAFPDPVFHVFQFEFVGVAVGGGPGRSATV